MTVANKAIKVKIQWSVGNYVHSEEEFTGDTLAELIFLLKRRIMTLGNEITAANDRYGDLRAYTPQFANGYMSLGCVEAEWVDDYSGCIMSMTVHDKVCEYRSRGQTQLRRALGLY